MNQHPLAVTPFIAAKWGATIRTDIPPLTNAELRKIKQGDRQCRTPGARAKITEAMKKLGTFNNVEVEAKTGCKMGTVKAEIQHQLKAGNVVVVGKEENRTVYEWIGGEK